MSHLLRVQLRDVPGSLGRLASAIGSAGGNIDAIEIVGRDAGTAVDDVFLSLDPGVMPDSIVSACHLLDGVEVLWISRYAAGTNIFLDLEAVESMTQDPKLAPNTLVEMAPTVFRADWSMRVQKGASGLDVLHRTSAAPSEIPSDIDGWPELEVSQTAYGDLLTATALLNSADAVVIARRGGPSFLDSELARLRHLVQLAASISR